MADTRHIVLDTETTGLEPADGHRIIEIGCVELINSVPSGREYRVYVNPERAVSQAAHDITGLDDRFLADKPRFAEIIDDLLAFITDAPLIIHNAPFDMGFLHKEFDLCGRIALIDNEIIDTLVIARKRFPGAQASVDALCARFGIDNSHREKHGALLDAYLLADIYIALTGGREPGFSFDVNSSEAAGDAVDTTRAPARPRPTPLATRLDATMMDTHLRFVASFKKKALWFK